jgi:hypothetical protein
MPALERRGIRGEPVVRLGPKLQGVDRILGGAKLGELPVQHPKKFNVVINLTTAKRPKLTAPPAPRWAI